MTLMDNHNELGRRCFCNGKRNSLTFCMVDFQLKLTGNMQII